MGFTPPAFNEIAELGFEGTLAGLERYLQATSPAVRYKLIYESAGHGPNSWICSWYRVAETGVSSLMGNAIAPSREGARLEAGLAAYATDPASNHL